MSGFDPEVEGIITNVIYTIRDYYEMVDQWDGSLPPPRLDLSGRSVSELRAVAGLSGLVQDAEVELVKRYERGAF